MIAEKPEMVRAIVKATLRGMKYVMDDPAKAAITYVEASPSFKGKEELMKKILANYKMRTYEGQSELGAMDPQAARQPAELLQAARLHRGRAAGRSALQQRLHQVRTNVRMTFSPLVPAKAGTQDVSRTGCPLSRA